MLLPPLFNRRRPAERRAAPRRRPPEPPGVAVLAAPSFQSQRAILQDVSATGVGLLTWDRVRAGQTLLVQVRTPSGGTCTLLARVVHATALSSGGWLLGCQWLSRPSEEQLQLALRRPVEFTHGGSPAR